MMDFTTLLPLLLTGASTGLTCGVSCGACGNPMVNVFLAGYLFTHTDRMKKSLFAFIGYHMGKAITVSVLCMLISYFGAWVVDEQGNLFGIHLHRLVYIVMLIFIVILMLRWFLDNKKQGQFQCSSTCQKHKRVAHSFGAMFFYGMFSGMSPCASLLVVLSYVSAFGVGEAILVGLSFSLANSVVPLLLLAALTGLLSEQMHREIPEKIRYFQLATYILFSCVLLRNLLLTI